MSNRVIDEVLGKIYNVPCEDICFIDADSDKKYSYSDLIKKIKISKSKLLNLNAQPGDHVILVGGHDIDTYSIFIACVQLRCIVIPTQDNIGKDSIIKVLDGYCQKIFIFFESKIVEIKSHKHKECNLIKYLNQNLLPGLILFTSGSTGEPKGVVYNIEKTFSIYKNNQKKKFVSIPFLMFDHFGGINTVFNILTMGGTIVNMKLKNPENVFTAIQNYKVTLLPTTPSFLNISMNKLSDKYDLSSLRMITYGSEVMSDTILEKLKRRHPSIKFLQTYGLSETGVLKTKSRADGTWIRLIENGYTYKIVKNRLYIKSSFSMIGYLGSTVMSDSEWFDTNDIVVQDGDYIKILGRDSDIVNVAGNKVYPIEVESVILKIPGVEDVLVCGEKSNISGNILVAKVQCKDDSQFLIIKNLIRIECNKKLGLHKVPNKILLINRNLYSSRMKKIRSH
jgi:acyl-CoA synthetase (AMP-forming)/AMP-acid ligase II